jgi:hypothetical protein
MRAGARGALGPPVNPPPLKPWEGPGGWHGRKATHRSRPRGLSSR